MSPKNLERFSSLKDNTLVAAAFIEVLCPVKYSIFRVKECLHTLIIRDTLLFHQFFSEVEELVVQLVVLVMLIVIDSHLDKTVLN